LKRHIDLTQGNVAKHLILLTLPMIGGIFAIMAYNLTDTYFVSRLGTEELAAITFTFPVVMVVGALALGMGMGAGSCISRALGAGDFHRVQRLTTDGIFLSLLIVGAVGFIGLLTIDPVFTALGAKPGQLPLIREYMTLWYSFVAVTVLPMVGNHMIRATGKTVLPSLLMILGAMLNVVLDPILIFGWGPVPALGIYGAVLATVASRFVSGAILLWMLARHYGMLDLTRPRWHELLDSWKDMLRVAVPTAGTEMLMPASRALLVRLVALYGTSAVAAVGAGVRIEQFLYIVPIAMGTCLIPLAGQNWGAARLDRVRRVRTTSAMFDISYGLLSFLLALVAAAPIARQFSDDPEVVRQIVWYVRAILFGSALHHAGVHTGYLFNAINHPGWAAMFNALRMPTIMILCAWIGMSLGGLHGLFLGLGIAPIFSGIIGLAWFEFAIRRAERRRAAAE
jgi:putative MATE family efflux protein